MYCLGVMGQVIFDYNRQLSLLSGGHCITKYCDVTKSLNLESHNKVSPKMNRYREERNGTFQFSKFFARRNFFVDGVH